MKDIELLSTITCPECNFRKEEVMPENACVHFYKCKNCGSILKPKQGDCCVFCSYGNVKCPPMQADPSKGKCCWFAVPLYSDYVSVS